MTVLVEVGLLLLLASLGGVIANRLRIPPVLGLLFIGAVIGPHALGMVAQTETVDFFAEIGAVLLLFAIGVEFSASKLSKLGLRIFAITALKLAIVFFLTYQLSLLLGLDRTTALYMGTILAVTSTALMIKIVEQKSFFKREEVPLLIATLVVEDLFAVFALTVFSSTSQGTGVANTASLAFSIVFSLLLLLAVYFVLLTVLKKVFDYIVHYQAAETMTLMGLGIGVGFSYVAQLLGLAPSIGAFLAGSLTASLPKGELLEKSVSPFVLAFSSIFFLSIGLFVDFAAVSQNAWIIFAFILANVLFKFFGSYSSTYLFGFTSKQAAFSGLAMLSVGEFSLLIAREGASASSFDLIGTTSVIVFFSTLFSAMTLDKFETVDSALKKWLPLRVKRTAYKASCAFCEATSSIEHAGNRGITAWKNGAFYWIAGVVVLIGGGLSSAVPIQIAGFTATQLSVLISSLAFAFGIQRTIESLTPKKTKTVERLSKALAMISFLLILPFIAEAMQAEVGLSELLLFAFAGAVGWYILRVSSSESPPKEKDWKEKGIMFFKN
jgi:Kef-type K+ transport system membrane component KefB